MVGNYPVRRLKFNPNFQPTISILQAIYQPLKLITFSKLSLISPDKIPTITKILQNVLEKVYKWAFFTR